MLQPAQITFVESIGAGGDVSEVDHPDVCRLDGAVRRTVVHVQQRRTVKRPVTLHFEEGVHSARALHQSLCDIDGSLVGRAVATQPTYHCLCDLVHSLNALGVRTGQLDTRAVTPVRRVGRDCDAVFGGGLLVGLCDHLVPLGVAGLVIVQAVAHLDVALAGHRQTTDQVAQLYQTPFRPALSAVLFSVLFVFVSLDVREPLGVEVDVVAGRGEHDELPGPVDLLHPQHQLLSTLRPHTLNSGCVDSVVRFAWEGGGAVGVVGGGEGHAV
mmetsp:Transcript_21046/g.60086  ORF Transcript_21046/g.60086 Transcript_21046/m.60086 type:complete len:270 (+) Transcript_21046:678-1487(+)